MDPDSEIITATTVTPGNAGDASVAADLITDLYPEQPPSTDQPPGSDQPSSTEEPARVYGDNAYGTGKFQEHLDEAGIDSRCKTQAPNAPGGRFGKDRFEIDLGAGTVRCPGGITAPIRPARDGGGTAHFGPACAQCPLRGQCTTAAEGRTITLGPHEATLARARARQVDPDWILDYRATRPKVERKIGHMMRRKHGGRRARMRGTARVDADFRLLAAAINLARLAVLNVRYTDTGWAAPA